MLEFDGLFIRIEARSTACLHWLREFLAPSFSEVRTGDPDYVVRLTDDDEEYDAEFARSEESETEVSCFQRDSGYARLPLRTEPGGRRVLYEQRQGVIYRTSGTGARVEVLTRSGDMRQRKAMLQVTRELAMARCWRPGRMIVHGAAFAREGRGILIAGPKQAGKTTLLVHCLRASSTEILTNDRALLAADSSQVTLRGIPTFVSIRPGTRTLFPHLSETLRQRGYHPQLALGEEPDRPQAPRPEDQDVYLTPAQFAEALARENRSTAPLAAVLYPRKTQGHRIRMRSLDAREASERLLRNLFGSKTRGQPAQGFTHGAPRLDETALETLCSKMVRHVPSFECPVGAGALESTETAEELAQEVFEQLR